MGCGLTLHAPAALRLDADVLKAEYAALDVALPAEERTHYGAEPGTGWTAIPLMIGIRSCPALDLMPSARALLERADLAVARAYILRQPARGTLAWHFDHAALHLEETRLLTAIHAPPDAVTRFGHESAAYPEGQCWTGDFALPHQVENPGDRDRIVLAVDVKTTDAVRALFPAALAAEPERRHALAQQAQNLLRAWRAGIAVHTAEPAFA